MITIKQHSKQLDVTINSAAFKNYLIDQDFERCNKNREIDDMRRDYIKEKKKTNKRIVGM